VGKDGLWFRGGECWYLDTSVRGRRIRRSLNTTSRPEALTKARQLMAQLERAGPRVLRAERTTFNDLADLIVQDYSRNERRSTGKLLTILERLRDTFGGWRAVDIRGADVSDYIDRRKRAGAANGTVNRELAALKRSFRLGVRRELISHDDVPIMDLLQEANPRAGFFERRQFDALLKHLPPEVQLVAHFGYELGWRFREIVTLAWRQVNLVDGIVRLDPGSTKNNEGRVAYLSPELLAILQAQHAATRELEREKGIIVPWVFHRKGRRILRFLASWQTACKKAGIPGMLFHDLRRTAVRNMVRAGVPERVAMQISGHRTRSVFERYNITSDADLREAAKRIAAHNNGSADRHYSAAGGPAPTGSMPEGQ